MRIVQACGLKIDNILLMKFANERSNVIDYSSLIRELLSATN